MFTYFSLCVAGLGLLASRVVALPVTSSLESRQSISVLTSSAVAAFKTYSYYASTAYCAPSTTLTWSCGANCNANSDFKPVASGGNGDNVQFWYVGYDPSLRTVIVAHQGTDTSKLLPILTDANIILAGLDASLFPGISSAIKVHSGFKESHAESADLMVPEQQLTYFLSSATSVLAAVKQAISTYGTQSVTVVGHSLGGAIGLISAVYLDLQLPAATVSAITYGMPRVGNQEFANYVDAHISISHVNNRQDLVPILPGRFLGFRHSSGEKHILDDSSWVACPGQDNEDERCTTGEVGSIFEGDADDHSGPYDGVNMGC